MSTPQQSQPFPEDAFRQNPKSYSLTLAKGMAILGMFGPDLHVVCFQSAATHLGTSRATARRLILTLVPLGYLERRGNDYALTGKALAISRSFLSDNSIVPTLAEKVRELAAQIDRPCSVVALNGPDIMFLCRDPSRRIYASQLSLGNRLPAHASAGGKLLLSLKADEDLLAWFDRYAPKGLGPRTITEPQAMLEEVARIRNQGFSISDCELEEGMISLGLPLQDHHGQTRLALVISQLSVQGTAREFEKRVMAPARLMADEISKIYADYLRHNA